jgi:hypothetical protein
VDVLNLNQPTNMTFAYQRDDWKSGNAIRVCGPLSLFIALLFNSLPEQINSLSSPKRGSFNLSSVG